MSSSFLKIFFIELVENIIYLLSHFLLYVNICFQWIDAKTDKEETKIFGELFLTLLLPTC